MQGTGSNERVRLMRDSTVHALGLVLSSVAGLLLVPIMVRGLGAERYGLWMASVAAIGVFGAFDLGLRLIIVRDLAGELRPQRAPVIRAMLWLHVFVGLIAGAIVATGGTLGASKLHLSPEVKSAAPFVFALAAVGCFFDQVFLYVTAVWSGLRKFRLLNAVSVAASVVRIAMFWLALESGKGIVTIAALNLAISAGCATLGLLWIILAAPDLRPRFEMPRWKLLLEPLGFGALSQAATSIASLQAPLSTLLISVINGAAAVTPFTIGQKFPNLISGLTWRASEVFFPVASRQGAGEELDPEKFIRGIIRWLALTIVPAAVGLFLIAPVLLRAWMGSVDPTALAILRLACAAVVVEILLPGAIQLFWGAGQTGVVLIVNLATMTADVLLAVILLPRLGPVGAAWATLGSTVLAAVLFLGFVASRRRTRILPTLWHSFRRVAPALMIALAPAFFLARTIEGRNWPAVLGTVVISALLYLTMLWYYSASEDEKAVLASLVGRDYFRK
jgi:O-antigen/teichoic acid export membrane protein